MQENFDNLNRITDLLKENENQEEKEIEKENKNVQANNQNTIFEKTNNLNNQSTSNVSNVLNASNASNDLFDLIKNIQSKMNNNIEKENIDKKNAKNINEVNIDKSNFESNSNDKMNMLYNMMKNFNNSNNKNDENTKKQEEQSDNNNNFNFDMDTILKIQKIISSMNKKDPRKNLLLSLKPFLRQSRQDKIGEYINILNITNALGIFDNKGSD